MKTLATGFVFSFVILTSHNGLPPFVEFVVFEIRRFLEGYAHAQLIRLNSIQFKSFIHIRVFAQNLAKDTSSA